jgi:CIC family chloride channel protein
MPSASSPSAESTPLPRPRAQRTLAALIGDATPLDLRLIGRTLLRAALVGALAGAVAVLFFAGLEVVESFLLGKLVGHARLRAAGEKVIEIPFGPDHLTFRPWLLLFVPAAGALLGGVLSAKLAPETQGGGGDAMIEAFHHKGGHIRKRVAWVKSLASILTLGSGGSGGREGPTMLIGGALGSLVADGLKVSPRERRILMIAGVAAGMSAIFRTPLGAALLATEVLYRDDFESDALIPALLASVVSYSVFVSVFGESTLFAHAPHYPFIPAHLPLYILLALLLALLAMAFLAALQAVRRWSARLPLPLWARPGVGGLALGAISAPVLWWFGTHLGLPGQGLGILGGGYGAAQIAITGASWVPEGWRGVEILLLLCAGKLITSSLTIGTGGSAGDFAPSLVLGGLFGGAFGHVLRFVLHDPRIDPGAFALVGMGTFYGGVAHVPVSSLVMVCELAGSYDLLVPLMLAEGVAFIALRNQSLYGAQVPSKQDSPMHTSSELDVLTSIAVRDVIVEGRPFVSFDPGTPASEMVPRIAEAGWQDTFPVLDSGGKLLGVVTAESLRILSSEPDLSAMTLAVDAMAPAATVRVDDNLRTAAQVMVDNALREVPVVDIAGRIVAFIDEAEVGRAYLESTSQMNVSPAPNPAPAQGGLSAAAR